MASVASQQDFAWQQLGIIPGVALRLFGMRRSGNHAIVGWMQRNAPGGRSVFLNNCKPGNDPIRSFRGIEVDGAHAPQHKALRDMASVAGTAGNGALLVMSYEDTSPAEFTGERQVSGPFDEGLLTRNVVIYRSFLNWSASLLKKMQGNSGYSLVRRNAILLRAMDTYTRLLGLVEQARDLAISCISYDRWCGDAAYRAALLGELGLETRDNTLGTVQRYGGGSSFQKEAQSAEDLQTDQRWRQMAGDAEYQAVLHLAARDTALTDRLSRLFPADAAVLSGIAAKAPMANGGLA
ncbi:MULTISPECIES: hypothetical protein [Rhodobacterales]|jgi:hypothetical protein|uniref:hypothetical protein n=1 Tax=Rhodobacterales TaxID=204455 RepID=UPI00237F9C38|nr:hypothetical protein [Phaeobacter gallaeciensis]MDE4140342.1 hypothetical protein [Phaeobacter gallaeciensis]MDE4148965.1 hypothetical protein [Phaeobacter gallaeciensis]MDE4153187.1 hypothetical protein [Phaeobacter gallaeciensis]MDE4228399.1 hypothetical protein [Phaeobacter gallaeciensis]MDE4257475.1 hypothetical protein [Phaeobacter gallaeciensis]